MQWTHQKMKLYALQRQTRKLLLSNHKVDSISLAVVTSNPNSKVNTSKPKVGDTRHEIPSSLEDTLVTPFDISPLPQAPPQTQSSRPSQGATVFTSTPNYLLVKEKIKTPRSTLQAARKAISLKVFGKKKENKGASFDEYDAACIFCLELFSKS
ncbi:unnamed protein product [Psylliodes chrysocephalus]|uniref:Uncharacterized protein n=1 Tax=Psylliodes chrysocephalus TaxID=3402493 RepID=A0A9P0D4L8_9CUCU|nr:unnamed protein product [Psylliodes chrysocephala]